MPVMLAMGEYREDIDLLLLPGGPDVNPQRYGEIPSVFNTRQSNQLEFFDENVLPEYINSNIPIFGICRGFQSLVVHFGGSLEQHMFSLHPHSVKHRGELVDEVEFTDDISDDMKTYLSLYLPGINDNGNRTTKQVQPVNSIHHQCVKDPGETVIIGESEDGTAEVMHHPDLRIAGVQYHPEELVGIDGIAMSLIYNLMGLNEEYIEPTKDLINET
jgi:gamma-glutamyl-gamma-aminobutyrate hydrolase PuuD